METGTAEHQQVYKHLLTYHCYRNGHRDPTETVLYLSQAYGPDFITIETVRQLYLRFDQCDFSFDVLFSADYLPQSNNINDLTTNSQTPFTSNTGDSAPPPQPPPFTTSNDPSEAFDPTDDEVEDEPDYADHNTDQAMCARKTRKAPQRPALSKRSSSNEPRLGSETPESQPTPSTTPSSVNNENQQPLPPSSRNMKRRQLFLHCFEANYSATEAARYLNSVYGGNFCTKTSVCGWYRKFRSADFDLIDKPRSGRRAAMDDTKLVDYMEANPNAVVPALCGHFRVHRKTMIRCLARLGYRFVTDHWVRITDREEVNDKQLCEYKLSNPTATVRHIAEHFQINRAVVARRLRSMGFNIPKWPTWPKKRVESRGGGGDGNSGGNGGGGRSEDRDDEVSSVASQTPPPPRSNSELFRDRGQSSSQCPEFSDFSQSETIYVDTTDDDRLTANSTPDDSSTMSIASVLLVSESTDASVVPTYNQNQDHQTQSDLLQSQCQSLPSTSSGQTSSSANVLPALLRHKVQQLNPTQLICSSTTVGHYYQLTNNPSSSNALQCTTTTTNSNTVQPSSNESVIVSHPPSLMMVSNLSTTASSATTSGPMLSFPITEDALFETDSLLQAFDPYNPPLDNVQMQSILHPYYM